MSVLDIRDLKKSYASPEGGIQAVVDVPEFSMDEGDQVALEGASGSGKTTLLNIIAGILKPDSGSVEIDGEAMSEMSEGSRDVFRGRKIGYVFQTFNLLQGFSVYENLELAMSFGRGIDREWIDHLIERVGLKDRAKHRPGQLSVGQQQRVAVARALANRPRIVLADEPTGNLDVKNALEALELIRGICSENNAALLLVSHDRYILDAFENQKKLHEINRAAADPEALVAAMSEGKGGTGE